MSFRNFLTSNLCCLILTLFLFLSSFPRLRLLSPSPASSASSPGSHQRAQPRRQPRRPRWKGRRGRRQSRAGRGGLGPRAHTHPGGSAELAGGHRRRAAGKDDGKRRIEWRCGARVGRGRAHLHGQFHAKEETALQLKAQETDHDHRHEAAAGAAVSHAQEPHPQGLHQHRGVEVSFSHVRKSAARCLVPKKAKYTCKCFDSTSRLSKAAVT